MEKKNIESRITIILIIMSLIIIIIPVTLYIKKTHQDKLHLVLSKNIIEKAEKCFNENKCQDKKITLEELIEKDYINKQYDPVTKELISNNSYILLDTKEFIIEE